MKKIIGLSVLICVAAFAQRGGAQHSGGGHPAVGRLTDLRRQGRPSRRALLPLPRAPGRRLRTT